ncbi:MAG: phosphoribosyltransferase [Pyrinomonadaceae bacterium]|nr:phosphoribosyltransferase [Pyrinomonadaceae bacterium]
MYQRFANRIEGGKVLAADLLKFKDRKDAVVLALPRGGVPVACEVAKALNLPLDIFMVRKLGVPFREELAFGAVASGNVTVLNKSLINTFRIPDSVIKKTLEKEKAELMRREAAYRQDGLQIDLKNKIVIIVDDGIATGASMKAAVVAIRQLDPKQIVVAAPVASQDACTAMQKNTNEQCICTISPEPFRGVGAWYDDFEQTRDAEVCHLLESANQTVVQKHPKHAALH